MKRHSLKTEGNNDLPLVFKLNFNAKNDKCNNCKIKGLKIEKSLSNFEKWDLNTRNEKINNIIKKNCEKTNNYSFDFKVFQNDIDKKDIKLKSNKISYPFNTNIALNIKNRENKDNKRYKTDLPLENNKNNDNDFLDNNFNDNNNIYYIKNYQDVLNERKEYELKMHTCIKNLTEINNNLNDLYNQKNKMKVRKSASSVSMFGFSPKIKIKEKTIKRKDKLNILNYQLTNDIPIFKCEGVFNNVTQSNIIKQENLNNNKQKIKIKEKDIKKTEKQLLKCVKSITNYYLNILKKSIDIRKEGMIWVVKRLLRLNYIPKKVDFPEFVDDKLYLFIINISRLKNELYDLINEHAKIKKELLSETDFINMQKLIKEIEENQENDLIPKKRNYSADNSKYSNKDNNNFQKSYLEKIYDKYYDKVLFNNLPEKIQVLLYFVKKNIKLNKNLNKKNLNKNNHNKNISNTLSMKNDKKNLLKKKSEIYSDKIKMKNRFMKLKDEEKWNKQLKLKRKNTVDYLKQKNIINTEEKNKYMGGLNINIDTYKKIKEFIILKLKIENINSNLKKEISDTEKYLDSQKYKKSYEKINVFIFGNKIM